MHTCFGRHSLGFFIHNMSNLAVVRISALIKTRFLIFLREVTFKTKNQGRQRIEP